MQAQELFAREFITLWGREPISQNQHKTDLGFVSGLYGQLR